MPASSVNSNAIATGGCQMFRRNMIKASDVANYSVAGPIANREGYLVQISRQILETEVRKAECRVFLIGEQRWRELIQTAP